MSAIKKFFANQRAVKAREDAYYARLEEKMNTPVTIVQDTSAFDNEVEHFDFLLKRNWFLDEDHVHELLWTASEPVFQEILKRIKSYPGNIQQALFAFIPLHIGNVRMKIRELSDEDMDNREIEICETVRKMLEDAWNEYKTKNNLEPPVGYLDSEMDDMYGQLQSLKKDLDNAKKKSLTGRYVPPGMRDKIVSDDPKVLSLTKDIQKLENEINTQKRVIEQERNAWFSDKRTKFEQEMFAV